MFLRLIRGNARMVSVRVLIRAREPGAACTLAVSIWNVNLGFFVIALGLP